MLEEGLDHSRQPSRSTQTLCTMLLTSRRLRLSTFFEGSTHDRVLCTCVKALQLCEATEADSLPLVAVLCHLTYLKPGSLSDRSGGAFKLVSHMQRLSKVLDDLLFEKCSNDEAVPPLLLVTLATIREPDLCELSH